MLNMRLARPAVLVDIRRLPGLDRIAVHDGAIELGAMVRQRDAELSEELARTCPLCVAALRQVGHPQIRSRGTIGGSVAHADPAAELCAVALALDGVCHLASSTGNRTVPAREFFLAPFTTAVRQDEVLVALELPRQPSGAGWALNEIARRPGVNALCGVVAQLAVDGDGQARDVRIALFGVGPTPLRAPEAEALLLGRPPDDETLSTAAQAAAAGLSPPSDVHASSEFRTHLVEVVTRRTLKEALERVRTP
jgi:carbon-monoxide dehydrogenase medium subunit